MDNYSSEDEGAAEGDDAKAEEKDHRDVKDPGEDQGKYKNDLKHCNHHLLALGEASLTKVSYHDDTKDKSTEEEGLISS